LRSSGLLTFKDLAQNQSFSYFSLVFSAQHRDAFKRVLSGKRAAQLPKHSRRQKKWATALFNASTPALRRKAKQTKKAQPKKKKGGMRLLRTHHTHHHSATERQLITISV
jgi:hypothetical protein